MQKASSPDRIDDLMRVAQPRGWLATMAILFLFAVAFLWGFLGEIPTKVKGKGVILRSGTVGEVYSRGKGELIQLFVFDGDTVSKGQVVGNIRQTDLRSEIANLEKHISELTKDYDSQNKIADDILVIEMHYLDQQHNSVQLSIYQNREEQKIIQERIEDQEFLLEKGLITRQKYLNSVDEFKHLQIEESRLNNDLTQIEIQRNKYSSEAQTNILDNELIVNDEVRKLDILKLRLDETENLVSNFDGIVLEQVAFVGSLINEGEIILIVEPYTDSQDHKAIAFVPLKDSKKLVQDMKGYVIPSVVKKEEKGMMIGRVKHIAEYPFSYVGLVNVLGSDLLAEEISKIGTPVYIDIALEKDADSYSGYKWTSGKGPDIRLKSGTEVDISIVIKKQKPISLLLPWLKKISGIY